jgi:Arc/MetJ-type ribon-helix-helix transcriptional regulator
VGTLTELDSRDRLRYPDEVVGDGRRISVRLPPTLCDDLDRLVEDGPFSNESAAVRTALARLTDAPEIQTRSLDGHLARRLAATSETAITFKAREVAEALGVTPQQLAQSIQHHQETPDTLVCIEQWSDGTHRSVLWRATLRLSVPDAVPIEQTTEAVDD